MTIIVTGWLPEPDIRNHQAIGKLAEEAIELAGICARILIQGLEHSNPSNDEANRAALRKEMSDVCAAMTFAMGVTKEAPMPARVNEKLESYKRWFELINAGDVEAESYADATTEFQGII